MIDANPQGDLIPSLGWQNSDEIDATRSMQLEVIIQDKTMPPHEGILHYDEEIDLRPLSTDHATFRII